MLRCPHSAPLAPVRAQHSPSPAAVFASHHTAICRCPGASRGLRAESSCHWGHHSRSRTPSEHGNGSSLLAPLRAAAVEHDAPSTTSTLVLPLLGSNLPFSLHAAAPAGTVQLAPSEQDALLPSEAVPQAAEDENPPETGVLPEEVLRNLHEYRRVEAHSAVATSTSHISSGFAYSTAQRNQIRESWDALMRWSKVFRTRRDAGSPLEATDKIVVFGGGSFGTAMGCALAKQKPSLEVVLLVRDPYLCKDINTLHENTRYLKSFIMPPNVRATTHAPEAIAGAKYAVHAVPVQSSRAFLQGIKELLPSNVPIICVSKGLEVGSGQTMSEVIPTALERKQPAVFLSGPSFAKEVMQGRPTGVVAACKDAKLARTVQALFASPTMRVNTTTDVVGVEICGALKNVLAIAAGIVEGMDLGHNALAALIAQGCAEIRWLAEKIGAKPTTMSGLSGLGDIMLTCYGDLSRNRTVGMRLGRGERLEDILASSPQVAEGVATAGVVVTLARKYRVSLPVLTAVAQVLDNNLTAREAVFHIMNLPQIEEA